MAKDEADHTGSTLSSIALLQERFRQLQRMKELRQERELMRSLSECKTSPNVAAQPRCQLALSLWPDSQTEARAEAWTPLKRYHSPPRFNLENDIDTSLRL